MLGQSYAQTLPEGFSFDLDCNMPQPINQKKPGHFSECIANIRQVSLGLLSAAWCHPEQMKNPLVKFEYMIVPTYYKNIF